MNSVQENKNELEAAVRYCESAISRAKSTIESMEFRQQAATKAWHEQTGREAALEREVARLRAINAERETMVEEGKEARADLLMKIEELKSEVAALEQSEHDLKFQYSEAKTNMALMTDENEELKERNDELKTQLVEWRDRSMGYTKEIGELKSDVEELSKSYNDEHHETNVWKKENAKLAASNARLLNKQQEMEQTMQLQKDQIAMFQRKMSRLNEVDR